MSRTKFFRILVVCVAILVGTVGLTSIALAGRKVEHIGYVLLDEGPNLWSDTLGEYIGEPTISEIDYSVILTIEKDDLVYSYFKCGWPPIVSSGAPPTFARKVRMDITPIAGDPSLVEPMATFLAVLEAEPADLENTLIGHLQVGVKTESVGIGEVLYVDFIVDTITRGVLKAAPHNIAPAVLDQYKFSSYNGLDTEYRHLVYSLNHQSCTINWNDQNLIGTITFGGEAVDLFVYKQPTALAPGKKPPKDDDPPPGLEPVNLGTVIFPFAYTTGRAADISPGPGKYKRLSVLWGDIKSQ